MRPDTHSEAKDVAQKCDYEEETNYYPHRVRVEFAAKVRNLFVNCSISPYLFIYIKAKRAKWYVLT